jgi:kynurenine formamidase
VKRQAVAALVAVLLCCGDPALELDGTRAVDLSHAFDADTIFWPTEEGFALELGFAGRTEQGYWYEANRFRSAEHGGTHIDAPVHFAEGRQSVDEIPLERLIGPAVVVDVREACAADPDYAIHVADLRAFESRHGAIPRGAIVLLHTGFSRFWPDRARYLGTTQRGPEAVPLLHFPGLAPEAAAWLVERHVRAVGIDTASIDPGQSNDFQAHQILFAADIPAFENLTSLDVLPARGFSVVALPMKIRGGSGGPLRAVALLR